MVQFVAVAFRDLACYFIITQLLTLSALIIRLWGNASHHVVRSSSYVPCKAALQLAIRDASATQRLWLIFHKVKMSLCLIKEHHEEVLGSGSITPRILNLGIRWRWVVSFTPRPLYPLGKSCWCPLNRRMGEPQSRSGCCGDKKKTCNCRDLTEVNVCSRLDWLTPWSRVLLEKLTVTQSVRKFPTFYGTRRFIIVFARARPNAGQSHKDS
jgi:hypothetical protein